METVGVATQGEFVLRMHQVYVDVSLAPQVLHAVAGEPHLGAVPGGEAGGLARRRSLESVLRDVERNAAARVLAVIGGPGSGKTTLARNTALALCEHRWRRRLPVLLYLRDHSARLLSGESPTLGEVAVSSGWLEGKVSEDWLERRLDRGGCVVLLDGLDEVADPAERSRVVAWVVRQTERHPRNIYVVTSRPHGYQSNPLPGAEVLQVRRFTGEQISQFLHQWSYAIESRARAHTRREVHAATDNLIVRLRTRASSRHELRTAGARNAEDLMVRLRNQPALYDLAANPLLLTMIANVHRYRGQLPGSRAELYAEMCDVLLHRRYEARGLSDATGLSGQHKQHITQHLALVMMQAKVRDWPVSDAAGAIHQPLQQVPGNVTSAVFLDEARKSGLLVEREHGFHGFAHLTLQEYLAAAQLSTPRADTTILTASVDDPWWRETILLWAAGNDATEVISACLDCGTVRALALAFDCADQAQIVDPAVRSRLEALLTESAHSQVADPALQRVLAGVMATRTLRETVQLNDSAALCARPIPQALYNMFIREEIAGRRHHPDIVSTDSRSNSCAVGMQAGDAERFTVWLNGITSEATYRLPTPDELKEQPAAIAAALRGHTVWAQDGNRTLLYQPPQVPWPYTPVPVTMRSRTAPTRSSVANDRQHITSYLRILAIPCEQRRQVLEWARVLSVAFTRTPEFRHSPNLESLNLALDLVFDLTLDLALDLVLTHALGGDYGTDVILRVAYYQPTNRTHAINRARAIDRARTLADVLNRDHFHDHVHASMLDSIDAGLALDPALDAIRGQFTYAFGGEPGDGLSRVRALRDAFNLSVNHTLSHAGEVSWPLNNGLMEALYRLRALNSTDASHPRNAETADVIAEALTFAFIRVTNLDPDIGDDLGLNVDSIETPGPFRLRLSAPERLTLAVDIALDQFAHPGIPSAAITTCRSLVATWEPPADMEITSALTDLDHFLAGVGGELSAPEKGPEDPVNAVRSVIDSLPIGANVAPIPLHVRRSAESTLELLTAMRDRILPSTDLTLACARVGLLAIAAALQAADQRDAAQTLRRALQSLTAQDRSSPNRQESNQILLLTRTQE
ncbi:NACHT domain-containing protein [Streptomyces chartreusis]|uniref:NACHT domain-containing protein n=1 Tax=Streptomyces chartreusis TaxID=1969 RepID=UPI003714D5EA